MCCIAIRQCDAMNLTSLHKLDLDVRAMERFALGAGIENLAELCFGRIRELLNYVLSGRYILHSEFRGNFDNDDDDYVDDGRRQQFSDSLLRLWDLGDVAAVLSKLKHDRRDRQQHERHHESRSSRGKQTPTATAMPKQDINLANRVIRRAIRLATNTPAALLAKASRHYYKGA